MISSVLPMSASAYSGTYVGKKVTTQTTDMGYATESQLIVYTHEIYGKTSVTSGYPTSTYVLIFGTTGTASTPVTMPLEESSGSGACYAQRVSSSSTYIGGASYHYISSQDDTNTTIDIGYNNMKTVKKDIEEIE